MTYKQALTKEMDKLASDPRVRFVGYNTAYGPRMNGTLCNVPIEKCVECPVAENLMTGIAIGLALEGFLPVLCFERMDFCLATADALINHIGKLQHYGMRLKIIIRVCIGNSKPLNPGEQHKQEYIELFRKEFLTGEFGERGFRYYDTIKVEEPVMIVERKEWYGQDIDWEYRPIAIGTSQV